MKFADHLRAACPGLTAREIAARIGPRCSERNVEDWQQGRAEPRPWVQDLILAHLARPERRRRA